MGRQVDKHVKLQADTLILVNNPSTRSFTSSSTPPHANWAAVQGWKWLVEEQAVGSVMQELGGEGSQDGRAAAAVAGADQDVGGGRSQLRRDGPMLVGSRGAPSSPPTSSTRSPNSDSETPSPLVGGRHLADAAVEGGSRRGRRVPDRLGRVRGLHGGAGSPARRRGTKDTARRSSSKGGPPTGRTRSIRYWVCTVSGVTPELEATVDD